MKVRIISALVLLPIFFFVIIYGGLVTKLAVLIVALISIKEFTNAFAASGIKPTNAILYIITILFLVPSWQNIWSVLPVLLFILVVGESILLIFGKKTVEDISVSILTFVYITISFGTFSFLHGQQIPVLTLQALLLESINLCQRLALKKP